MMHDSLIQFCEFLAPPFARAWLKKQLIDLKLYEERVKKLKDGVKNLKKARVVVEHRVDEEEKRYGREITNEVKEWIEAVRKIISEYEAFDEDEENHKLAVFDFIASGKLPKPGIRYSRSKEANVIIKKVDGLLQKAKHDTFSYWVDTPSMAAFFSNVDYISFPSRDETKKKIMAELGKPNVRMIGLHGLSGVGKTTLVKQVAEEVIEGMNKTFDQVIMASVTRNVDIRKIQGQLADMLGMKLDEESDIARAARIQKRLKNEKKSMLVILDDLWAKLDLNMVGIPSEDDGSGGFKNVKEEKSSVAGKSKVDASKKVISKNLPTNPNMMEKEDTPNRLKGCKVLLISESKQVLLSQMEGNGDRIFSLEVLKEEEAKMLFKQKAAIDDANAKLTKLAGEIANKCEGLPMSIIATAVALRNQRPSVWEEVNRNLEQQRFIGAPEFSTKLSYDLLENEELKYTFLLCARMGHDALVMDLVKYCIGLGFLQRIYTVREARDRVYVLVGKLKESSLLSDSNSKDHFTMQNIVRSAALSIASKEMHVFTLTKEKIDEWPKEDKLKRYAAISLHHCDIIEWFPRSINCPRLRVFHVNNNDPDLKIPDNFFKGMKELEVLILTGFTLSPLPRSIACLTKLRMLCLEQCILGEKLSIISQLKKLRILSLSGSDIAKLPSELKQLTKLQIFDISNCSKLREIPSNVLKSLINLEELYMRNTLIEWKDEEQTSHCENASLSELRHLNQLTTVDIQISNVDHLPKNLFFDKLYSYKIVIGDLKAYLETDFKMPEKYETSRFLAIHLKNRCDIHSQKGIKLLFKRVEILLLEDLSGVQDIFYRLSLKGFPYLKDLSIVSNSDIESLIKPEDRQCSEKAFPKLESLYLYNIKNMSKICSCKLSAPSFGKLKVIKIKLCGKLENIFLISVVRLLTDLKTIEVSECNSLKEIFAVETQRGPDEIEYLDFCELRSLTLQALPQFIRFYTNSSKGGETSGLFHEEVMFSKLETIVLSSIQIDIIWKDHPSLSSYFRNLIHLEVNDCWNLEYLLSFSTAKSLVNLQSLFVSECDKMSGLFPQGQDSHAKIEEGSILPNLKNMNLSSMKSLSEIWNSILPSDSFGKLDTLILEQCDKLVNVFPSNVEGKIFRSICNLTVTNCMSMNAVFDLGDKNRDAVDVTKLQDVHLEALPKLKHVWKWNKDQEGFLNLNNLQKIFVYDCDSLKNIFPVSMAKYLSNLEHLVVRDCLNLREIAAEGKGTNTNKSTIEFEFPKLSTIKLVDLPKLESFYPGVCELRCSALNDLSIERCDKLEPFRKETAEAQSKLTLFSEEVINKLNSMQIVLEPFRKGTADEQSKSALFIEEVINKLKSMQIVLEPFRKGTAEEQSKSTLFNEEVINKMKSMQIELEPFRKGILDEQSKLTLFSEEVINKLKSMQIVLEPLRNGTADARKPALFNEEVINMLKSMQIELEPFRKGTVYEQSKPAFFNEEVINKMKSMQIELEPFRKGILDEQSKLTLFSEEVINKLNSMQIVLEPFRKGTADEQSKSALFIEEVINKLKSMQIVLEPFRNGTADEQSKSALFNEEVINKLKSMQIESWHAKSSSSYMGKGNHRRDNLEDLHLSRLSDTEILYSFLHRNPNLERLSLNNCFFKEIVPLKNPFEIENMGVVPELKSLKLTVSPKLENIGFEGDIILQRIEVLILEKCPCLVTIVSSPSISLTHLTNLEVVDCDGLKNLMPPSTAKSLIQLSTLKVINCKSLEEIVSKKENEEENKGKDIVFRQLKVLELVSLNSLQSFCSSETYVFKFPSLENLVVSACPKMKKFSENNSTPILQKIYVVHEKEKKRCHWDGNINGTIQKLFMEKNFFEGTEEMSYSEYLELQQAAWHVGVGLQKNWFYSLKTLKLVNCDDIQPYAIPSYILPYLNSLNELEVRDCNKVEVIFEMNDTERASQLKILTLEGLLELTHIWENNCPGILSFQNLQQVCVSDCARLKTLFPLALAKKLKKLENLQIGQCDELQEIVVEDEAAATAGTTEKFVFPRLTSLHIYDSTRLTYFYPGAFTLECPALNDLYMAICKLELFYSTHPEAEAEGSINRDTGFLNLWAISNLRTYLGLDWKHALELRSRLEQFPAEDLKYLNELYLNLVEVDENEELTFLFDILRKTPNLETLLISPCSRPEIFVIQNPEFGEDGMLGHLKTLALWEMFEVDSIGSDDSSWLNRVCDKLHQLNVINCPFLKTLVHSAVSFSCLKELYISECAGLEYLFTSSAAEKLKHLEMITVKECGSMKKIVAKEQDETNSEIVDHDETTSEGIKFERLERITLHELSSMECFYSGNDTLQLPSLIQVDIWHCPKMVIFSQAWSHGELFRGIQASSDSNDELVFHGDLNASVKRAFLQQDHFVLNDSPMLQEIWCTLEPVPEYWCFCNLNSLIVEGCDFLSNAILPSHLLPFLSNMKELQVRKCNSVTTIFDDMGAASDPLSIGLEKLILEQLPSLKYIWKMDRGGRLSLPFLEEVLVDGCESIKSLFPASVAKHRLQKLVVDNCDGIVEIFAKDEATTEEADKEFIIFPDITSLRLSDLPNLRCIYPGMRILEWPILKEIDIFQCQMLKFFVKEFQNSPVSHPEGEDSSPTDEQAFVSLEKVISNLEVLKLDWKHTSDLLSMLGQFTEELKYLNGLNLFFDADWNAEPTFPLEILQKAPNINFLVIASCSRPEIFVTQNQEFGEDAMLGHLKSLALWGMYEMKSIGSDDSLLLNIICDRLHRLSFTSCPDLITLAHSAVSFSNLKELVIDECAGLKYLFTYSAVEKLKHLEEITVRKCGSMKEIILPKEQEETTSEIVPCNETTSHGIKFERLKRITLHELSRMECFYSGNDTLQLPSLIQVDIRKCPKMEIFSQALTHGELFRGIQASSDSNDELVLHGDLNASVKRVFLQQNIFEGMEEMNYSEYLELQQAAWHVGVGLQKNWFYSLKTLKLVNCDDIQPYAIPSYILPYLNSLNELEVRDCSKVEVVFEKNDTKRASQLKILTLEGLLELTHIWEKNHPGILSFQNLQQVCVSGCASLKTLFPATLAKNLKKLEILQIDTCNELQVIVVVEATAAALTTEKFVFPRLTELNIYNSTLLTYFYPGTFTLECPVLNSLHMVNCKLELFQSAHPESEGEGSRNRDTGLLNPRVISILKYLVLDWKHTSELRSKLGQFPEDLKYLNELYLDLFNVDENEEPTFPFEILQKAPNFESLMIGHCSTPEIFFAQNPEFDENGLLGHLKTLFLDQVSKLQSIGSEDSSWLNTVCYKLHKLKVRNCPDLTTLVHSAVSFSCLEELQISGCAGLKYLFTSSAAEMFKHLKTITVKECGSMKQILEKEHEETTSEIVDHDETTSEGIKFERLERITLHELSSMERFYSGNDTLQLPSLIQVSIRQCPKMEIFSQALTHGESFRGIQASSDTNDELVLHGDLNASVKRVFLQQDHLVLKDSPMVQKIWLKSEPTPDWCFCNLISLVMEGCDFLSNAMLPSHLLPFLSNLEELQVRKCKSVKAIFDDMIDMRPASDPLSIGLKKLILEELPNLKHIWKKDPRGSLSLPFLEEVLVDGCESIKSLFPASVAKQRLQKLDVKNCDGILQIFAKDEANAEADKEFIISPNITSLRLWNLPNLRCIYPGMRILEWPKLKELGILQCQMLKFFTREFQNSPDSYPEDQDSSPSDEQAFVSLEKVTPHLEVLWLSKEETMIIEQGKLHVDRQGLKALYLKSFDDESDVFQVVFGSKVPLPGIERLGVVDSAFKEIFPSQRPDIDSTKVLSQLKGLELQSLSQLESIGLEHSWMDPFLENLESLHVSACDCLDNLTPSPVSFSNLIELHVKDCHGLKCLFTSSTARRLPELKEMCIANCESIKEIVANEGDEEIKLEKLEILTLSSLPKLESFYSGSSTLNFPSLKEVSFNQCDDMDVICYGDIVAKQLEITLDGEKSVVIDINFLNKQNLDKKLRKEAAGLAQ